MFEAMKKNAMKPILLSLVILILAWPVDGRCDTIMRAVGGWEYDVFHAASATPDGGFIAAGVSTSLNDDQGDLWLHKYDSAGEREWVRTAGVWTSLEVARDVQATSDGGYIVAGETYSEDALNQVFLLKYAGNGNLVWARTVGGADHEYVAGVVEGTDGSYAVAGTTESYGVGTTIFLTRFSSSGTLLGWATTGSGGDDNAIGICALSGGGYMVAGETTSYGGDGEALLAKFSSGGGKQWLRTYGGAQSDIARSVLEMPGGDLLVAGQTWSYGPGDTNVFLFRTDSDGNLQWASAIGGSTGEGAYDICEVSDGGYLIAGYTASFSHGSYDLFMVKCDSDCQLQWSRAVGGSGMDLAYAVDEMTDGSYLMVGETGSFGAGPRDALLVKTGSGGMIHDCSWFDVAGAVQESASPTEQAQYPPSGGYALSAASPYIYQSNIGPFSENVCSSIDSTVSVSMECSPPDGVLPFILHFDLAVNNEYTGFSRRVYARLQAELAGGTIIPNWKSGSMNLGPGGSFQASFNQVLPDIPALEGLNTFTLFAEDITPAPYNQPPYPPSGDMDSTECRIYGLP